MPKAGKSLRPHESKLSIPKDEGKYRLKRLYWVLISMEKKMTNDITSIRYADYEAVLRDFTELSAQLKKKGVVKYNRGKPYTGARVDDKEVQTSNAEQGGASEVSGNGPSGVGSGLQTSNPLA